MTDASASAVPAALAAEVEQIAARAAAAGRPLRALPILEVSHKPSCAVVGPPGARQRPRVRLSEDVLSLDPAERAFTIAHELAHVLRHEEGAPPPVSRSLLAGTGAGAAVAVAAVLGAGASLAFHNGRHVGSLYLLVAAVLLSLAVMLFRGIRRDEAATDAIAAQVFGEVLTPAGVQRITRHEGRAMRYLPTVLRTHPRPAARRRAGHAARHR